MSVTPVDTTPLLPVDASGLAALAVAGKENPTKINTLAARTVVDKRFRSLTYVRDLEPLVVDEPPHLLGDNTAPAPSEVVLSALGACLSVGIQANAADRGIALTRIELELEGDINTTAVWGVGDLDDNKWLGFSNVRVKVNLEGDASREELDALVADADRWSPVGGTLRNPVDLIIAPA
jgi:uncharacterized OsmC-like protein